MLSISIVKAHWTGIKVLRRVKSKQATKREKTKSLYKHSIALIENDDRQGKRESERAKGKRAQEKYRSKWLTKKKKHKNSIMESK